MNNSKKIGIISFHSAHNYGSMLQNYALQKVIEKLGGSPVTINMRTERQKKQYEYFPSLKSHPNVRQLVKSAFYLPFRKQLIEKDRLFENFMNTHLKLTKEVNEDTIKGLEKFDVYISGSDQIWNPAAGDFSWNYFLEFCTPPILKMSYAASMGPNPFHLSNSLEILERIRKDLSSYSVISVREQRTKELVDSLHLEKECIVHVDPTILLSSKEWEQLLPEEHVVNGKYIFFYNPVFVRDAYEAAKKLAQISGLPVVTSNIANYKAVILFPGFKYRLDVGPIEFLDLVKNAEWVIGHSFHLMVFSILFRRKFIAVNGISDSRISNLLSLTGLERNATSESRSILDVYNDCANFGNFIDMRLETEKASSYTYLKKILCDEY